MSDTAKNSAPLTVALVHGAFADGLSWNGVNITEIEGSHEIMVSRPEAVAELILTGATAVDRLAVGARG